MQWSAVVTIFEALVTYHAGAVVLTREAVVCYLALPKHMPTDSFRAALFQVQQLQRSDRQVVVAQMTNELVVETNARSHHQVWKDKRANHTTAGSSMRRC